MLQCKDGKLYTGITNNLDSRIQQHNCGHGCRFTKYRIPVELLYCEEHFSRGEALRREAEIKGLTRTKKLQLVSNKIG